MQRSILIASVWFQALWFVAVLGRETTIVPLLGLVFATYLWSLKRRTLTVSMAMIFVIGFVVDVINFKLGLYQFEGSHLLMLPSWLVLLWCMFAWYAVIMKPVINSVHPMIIVGFSAVGGTLSYLAGARFGAVELPFGILTSAMVLLVEWALFAFIIIALSKSNSKNRSKVSDSAYKRNNPV
jgi:hypothetical protein